MEYAVEFDCRAGCNLTVEEMVGSFQSSITRRRPEVPHPVVPTGSPDAGRAAAPGSCPSPAIPAGGPSAGAPRTRRIHAMELIPGHAETVAEVWLWYGRATADDHAARSYVSLRSDDWPMWPATARRLAATLLAAAAIADRPHPDPDRPQGA